jgi:hypothetical protein
MMTAKITTLQLRSQIKGDPDMYALGFLPIDSFARHAYQNKSYPAIRSVYSVSNAEQKECERWRLTPEEWLEEMDAARLALAHDMRLDLIRHGYGLAG